MAYLDKNQQKTIKLRAVEKVFTDLKQSKLVIEDSELVKAYDNAQILADKYAKTGQIAALRKLVFTMKTINKERELLKLGYNQYVLKSAIDYYIDNSTETTRPVKIIELCNFVRDVPSDIVDKIEQTKHLFDEYFVVFTDYTGREERRIEKEKRARDPILFGCFLNRDARICNERFYFVGDWVDEYCDLTFDRMLSELGKINVKASKCKTPKTLGELEAMIKQDQQFTSLPVTLSTTKEKKEEKSKSIFKRLFSLMKHD